MDLLDWVRTRDKRRSRDWRYHYLGYMISWLAGVKVTWSALWMSRILECCLNSRHILWLFRQDLVNLKAYFVPELEVGLSIHGLVEEGNSLVPVVSASKDKCRRF